MNRIGLFDGCFVGQNAAGLGGDNIDESPKYIQWVRDEVLPITFFTDKHLEWAKDTEAKVKVAWLIEPPGVYNTCYQRILTLKDDFDYVVSCIDSLKHTDLKDKFIYCPIGGSWVKSQTVEKKKKMVSIIASEKTSAPGHALRHEIIAKYGGDIDVFGRKINPIKSKTKALKDYRYSIVVESYKADTYFTEKVIDCLALDTVPIYWGTDNISCPGNSFFASAGFDPFDNIDDLDKILYRIGKADYKTREKAIARNRELSADFRIAEDWLCKNTGIFHSALQYQ